MIMTDRLFNLGRAAQTSKSSVMNIASIYYDHWIVLYGIRAYLLTDSGTQFVSKLFGTIGNSLGLKHITTTAYKQQMDDQAERYNRMLIVRLHHYVAENQND